MPKAQIHFTILVDVRRVAERSRQAVEIEDAASTNVEEESHVLLAPVKRYDY